MAKVKRIIRNITALIIAAGLIAGFVLPVRADDVVDNTPVDFVLVLDCSGSMTKNDPEGLTKAAAKEFVDLLPNENLRLAVVTFGDDYGTAAYDLGRTPDNSTSRVKVALDLDYVSEFSDRDHAKQVLDQEIDARGQLSPIGYALEAAAKLLDAHETARGKGAIILLSDGQVEGQSDDYNAGMDFDSIDQAVSIAKSSEWPMYCMELNYRGENKEGKGLPGIAFHQMRKNIPPKTGTDPIELKSAEQASEVFRAIFEKFFPGSKTEVIGEETIKDGKAEFKYNISEILAEQNVFFEGQVAEVTKLEATSPSGETKSFTASSKSGADGNMVFCFEEKYIGLKIMAPSQGEWKYTVYGTDDITIRATGVKFMETNLQLEASLESGEIASGTKVDFKASFSYNGTQYENDTFYADHPAKLYINDQAIDMTSSSTGYTASYTFESKGAYRVYARVEDKDFRNGFKKSGEHRFTIDNEPTKVKGTIPTVNTHCGGETDVIDLTQYFESPDGDVLTYEVDFDKSVEIEEKLSPDGKLTLKAGTKAGTYPVEVTAKDGSGEEPVLQSFDLVIENSPLRMLQEIDPLNPQEFEIWVNGAGGPGEITLKCSDFFSDPDGFMPRIAIFTDDTNGAVDYQYDPMTGTIKFLAVKEGEGDAEIIALDENAPEDINFQQRLPLRFKVRNAGSEHRRTMAKVGGVAGGIGLLALILLGSLFIGRKIYGTWDVYSDGAGTESDRKLGTTGSGKHAKCRLDSLLSELDLNTGFPNVNLVAGNNLNKLVYVTGLQGMQVEVDGEPIEDPKKLAKVEIRPGHDIRIRSDMAAVTLTRLS